MNICIIIIVPKAQILNSLTYKYEIMESTDMQCLLHYYRDCLEIGREYGIYSVAGVDSQLLRLTQTLPGKMRGYVVYWKDMGCSYCKCFSGFGATASIGAKKKKRCEAGDGAGGCLEAV